MNRPIHVSVIIVSYNGRDKLLRCLTSLVPTLPTDSEVIVVDNASSDGSADAVESAFQNVRLIREEANLGFAAGNNRGVRMARGECLVFLNPDTGMQAGWLEPLLTDLKSEDRVGLVTSKILLFDSRINTCGNVVHFTGLTLCRGMGGSPDTFEQREEVDAVSGAAFAMRRDLFDQLGGFDEDTFLYMEDTDLSWRVRLAGWRCIYEPGSVVQHDYSLRFTPRKTFYQERNRYLMLLKNLKWATLFVLLPGILLAEVITWGFTLWSDRSTWRNKVGAYGWIIKHWPAVMEKRKRVQLLRKSSDRELLKHTSYKIEFDQVSKGAVAKLAGLVFNSLFFIWKCLMRLIVWW